jgi:hypothetical protein
MSGCPADPAGSKIRECLEEAEKGGSSMKVQQIKEIAQRMQIAPGKMKKTDLVRAIQGKEGNAECFDTGQSQTCGQLNCLWMEDCN